MQSIFANLTAPGRGWTLLTAAVRDSLVRHGAPTIRAAICAANLAGWAPTATADPFPSVIELDSLNGTDGFTVTGVAPYDAAGGSVAGAGDVNGDGMDDFIIGAKGVSSNQPDAGAAYILFGDSGGFPAVLGLESLDGINGFVLNGVRADDYTGISVSAAGDVNGDGVGDVIIGALRADPRGRRNAGTSYVVFGSAGTHAPALSLDSLDGSNGFALHGAARDDASGSVVSMAGDLNGDGFGDVVIAAWAANPHAVNRAGAAFVVFGRGSGFPAALDLGALDGTDGFALHGTDTHDYAGRSVSEAGDVNGDGIGDLIVGARGGDPADRNIAGEIYVLFGHTGSFVPELELSSIDGGNGFVIHGADAYDMAGQSASGAGDVNGDGVADIVIGAYFAAPDGMLWAGTAYVVFGRANGFTPTLDLATLDGHDGFAMPGLHPGDTLGDGVSGAGDVNDDGLDDLIVGAPDSDAHGEHFSGNAWVILGSRVDFPAVLDLTTLDGNDGFVLLGSGVAARTGAAVSGAGDVNGDQVDDIIVGAAGAPDGTAVGRTHIVFGRAVSYDGDGDGVADNSDNCTGLANPDQRDGDTDGIGNACDADLDQSCFVNFTDLGLFKSLFLTADPVADLDGNGIVDYADLVILKSSFFRAPGPSGVPNICTSERPDGAPVADERRVRLR
jgi:hypothetical protein